MRSQRQDPPIRGAGYEPTFQQERAKGWVSSTGLAYEDAAGLGGYTKYIQLGMIIDEYVRRNGKCAIEGDTRYNMACYI